MKYRKHNPVILDLYEISSSAYRDCAEMREQREKWREHAERLEKALRWFMSVHAQQRQLAFRGPCPCQGCELGRAALGEPDATPNKAYGSGDLGRII